jgi:hypothetical protein
VVDALDPVVRMLLAMGCSDVLVGVSSPTPPSSHVRV